MIELEVKTKEHIQALDAMRNLFRASIDNDEMDPDVFMESCLMFAIAYHMEFSEPELLDALIKQVRNQIKEKDYSDSDVDEEFESDESGRICH